MTKKELHFDSIWNILVNICGASVIYKESLKDYFFKSEYGEFRFQGDLGFGGKFYFDEFGWKVNYYKEDFTIPRETKREKANIELERLFLS